MRRHCAPLPSYWSRCQRAYLAGRRCAVCATPEGLRIRKHTGTPKVSFGKHGPSHDRFDIVCPACWWAPVHSPTKIPPAIIDGKRTVRHASPEEWAQARIWWDGLVPTREIARRMGLRIVTVWRYAQLHQWPRRKLIRPKQTDSAEWQQARAMWVDHRPAKEIAAFLDVPMQRVYQVSWELGWPARTAVRIPRERKPVPPKPRKRRLPDYGRSTHAPAPTLEQPIPEDQCTRCHRLLDDQKLCRRCLAEFDRFYLQQHTRAVAA